MDHLVHKSSIRKCRASNCIYRFISPSGKSYVGKAKKFSTRYTQHKRNINHGVKTKFYDAARKYGFDNFSYEILATCDDFKELNNLEIKFISEFRSYGPDGYNMTRGGDGTQLFGESNGMYNRNHTSESRELMSVHSVGKNTGSDNAWHISNQTKEARTYIAKAATKSRIENLQKMSPDELNQLRLERSERARAGYANSKNKHKILESLQYWTYKSEEELQAINAKKARKGTTNGRATEYRLESPDGYKYTVKLIAGLKEFCKNNDLIFRSFQLCLINNESVVPQPNSHDSYMSNAEYHAKRINSVGWKITKSRINGVQS